MNIHTHLHTRTHICIYLHTYRTHYTCIYYTGYTMNIHNIQHQPCPYRSCQTHTHTSTQTHAHTYVHTRTRTHTQTCSTRTDADTYIPCPCPFYHESKPRAYTWKCRAACSPGIKFQKSAQWSFCIMNPGESWLLRICTSACNSFAFLAAASAMILSSQKANLICVTWRIHIYDMTHSYVRQDAFMRVTWLTNAVTDQCHAYNIDQHHQHT